MTVPIFIHGERYLTMFFKPDFRSRISRVADEIFAHDKCST